MGHTGAMRTAHSDASSRMECHLGSAVRLVRRQNELVAITRYIKPTGYKNRASYGYSAVAQSETTNAAFQKKVVYASARKALVPYTPNAPRNRPKDALTNVVGNRHRLHPCIKHERYRGSSSIRFFDGNSDSLKPWKTTNQVFARCSRMADTVGLGNSGISSEVAKSMHRMQGLYGR